MTLFRIHLAGRNLLSAGILSAPGLVVLCVAVGDSEWRSVMTVRLYGHAPSHTGPGRWSW